MISKHESIPRRTEIGLSGLDVLYTQFNDVRFFVEDIEQEQLYHVILNKIFHNIRLSKIFPLGGKPNVLRKAKRYSRKKNVVFIVDKDFDDLRNLQEDIPNLYYLRQYSIENYLLEQSAIDSLIIEEKPRYKTNKIRRQFPLERFTLDKVTELVELFKLFLVAQEIGHVNCSLPPERFVDSSKKFIIDQTKVIAYKQELERLIADPRLFAAMYNKLGNLAFRSNPKRNMRHICGKYLCFLVKNKVCKEFHLKSIDNDSFCFRLAKGCCFKELKFLKEEITRSITLN